MSGEFDANTLKTPMAASLIRLAAAQAQHAIDQLGKRWPCTVSKVISSGIVEVNFEVAGAPFVPSRQLMPIAYSEYVRYPIQVGDKGYCGAADLRLGQMSGLGGGVPQVGDRPGNLTPLMFYWLGSTEWAATNIDPDALCMYASQDGCVTQVAASGLSVVGSNANAWVNDNLGVGNAASTSFTTPGGQLVTVMNGITVEVDPPPSPPSRVIVVTATEALAASALVNFWASGVRNASAADSTKLAWGFVTVGVSEGDPATVYLFGAVDTALSGLTPGTVYYLSAATPGAVVAVAPSSAGNLVQQIGIAATATQLVFDPQPGVLL